MERTNSLIQTPLNTQKGLQRIYWNSNSKTEYITYLLEDKELDMNSINISSVYQSFLTNKKNYIWDRQVNIVDQASGKSITEPPLNLIKGGVSPHRHQVKK